MKNWHLRDIILVTILAIFMGVIFWALNPVYTLLAAALAPLAYNRSPMKSYWEFG